ncbi:MAG: nucleotidyltransferase [Planctomycetota bacterium]
MHPDFRDLLSEFTARGVEFLVVGAHALAAHGHVRATKDLDLWIRRTRGNAARVHEALASFGAPLGELTVADLTVVGLIFQIGVEPVRIDIINEIDGVDFDDAWPDRVEADVDGLIVPLLSRRHLIQNKRASGRLQDLADLERLEEL